MIRVAHLIDSLKVGGAQKLQVSFARAGRERDLEMSIISLANTSDTPVLEELAAIQVPIVTFPAKKLFNFERLSKLYRFCRENKFDVIQTHLCTANILGPLIGRACGIPVVATLHSASFDPRFYKRGRYTLESRALRHGATRVVGVGNVVAQANQARVGRRKIHVIPNAIVATERFSAEARTQKRNELALQNAIIFISVGRLSLPKAYPDLLRAFAIVHARQSSARLLIVGTGQMQEEVTSLIQQLNLNDSVTLLGQRSDVPALLNAADVYVSSSHWEGLPVAILEAMSAGLPIASTSVGDIPKVVSSNSGILVPPRDIESLADAMIELACNPECRKQMSASAKDYVEKHHSPQIWIDQYISLYQELLSHRSDTLKAQEEIHFAGEIHQ
jgi:L-malate glycosyltransferase